MNEKLSRTSFAWSHVRVVDESQNKYVCNVMTADSDGVMIGCDHHFTIATRRGYKSIEEHLVKGHQYSLQNKYDDWVAEQKTAEFMNNRKLTAMFKQNDPSKFVRVVSLLVRHGVPLAFVEDPDFHTLTTGGFPQLTASNIRPMILGVADVLKESNLEEVRNQNVSLAFDAGTTNQEECLSVVGRRTMKQKAVCFSVGMSSLTNKDADSLATEMKRYITMISEYGGKVTEVVTDNAAAMLSAKRKLLDDFPHLLTSRCWCHLIQLSMHETMDIEDHVIQACEVVKKRVCPTRWWSSLELFEQGLKDSTFCHAEKAKLEAAIFFLAPFRVAGRVAEREASTQLHGLRCYLACMLHPYLNQDMKRFWFSRLYEVLTDELVCMAALSPLVDWGKCPRGTKSQMYTVLLPVLQRIAPFSAPEDVMMTIWNQYTSMSYQSDRRIQQTMAGFWGNAHVDDNFSELKKLYLVAESSQASEAPCERWFSHQALSHTKLRNRMNADLIQAECIIRTFDAASRESAREKKREREEPEPSPEHPRLSTKIPDNCPLKDHTISHDEFVLVFEMLHEAKRFSALPREGRVSFTGANGHSQNAKYQKCVQGMWRIEVKRSAGEPLTFFLGDRKEWSAAKFVFN
eukprot:PhM_4_TR8466/c1_g2_i2/m.47098